MESGEKVILPVGTYNALLNFIAKQSYETTVALISKAINDKEECDKNFEVKPILVANPND